MKIYFTVILFIAILCGCSICSSAQTAEKSSVEWGDVVQFEGNGMTNSVLSFQDRKMNILNINENFHNYKRSIATIDCETLKLLHEESVGYANGAYIAKISFTKGNKWFISMVNYKNKQTVFDAHEVDNLGKPTGKKKNIMTVNGVNLNSPWKDYTNDFVISDDSSKVAIIIQVPNKGSKDKKFIARVLDADMNPLWEQTIEEPEVKYYFTERTLTNAGKLYLVTYNSPYKIGESNAKDKDFNYILYSYDGKTRGRFVIELDKKFIISRYISERSDNGNTIVAGFYALKNEYIVNGIYFWELEKGTNKVVNKFTTIINPQNIKNVSKKLIENKTGFVAWLSMVHISFNEDGTMLFITGSGVSTFIGKLNTTYNSSKGCVLFNTNTKGEINWTASIPLNQLNALPISGGIFRLTKNAAYFIYNENKDNLEEEYDTTPERTTAHAVIVEAKIDENGKITRKVISNEDPDGYIFSPKLSVSASENELIFVAMKFKLGNTSDVKIGRIKLVDW
jgi:hypothetical protein